MKPTHVGRLKSFNELFKLDRSLWPNVITAGYMKDLAELMGKEIELDKKENHIKENHYGAGDILIHRDWFLDLREIKPEIEIPKTPFWILKGGVYKVSSNGYSEYFLYNKHGSKISGKVEKHTVQEFLNNGTWTICDAPEKVMVPWSDEDWKEWFLNDGVYKIGFGDLCRALGASNSGIKVAGEEGKSTWVLFHDFISNRTDRHGNKFEKEA